jgi:hypothetical protein
MHADTSDDKRPIEAINNSVLATQHNAKAQRIKTIPVARTF